MKCNRILFFLKIYIFFFSQHIMMESSIPGEYKNIEENIIK